MQPALQRAVRLDYQRISMGATPVEIRPEGWKLYEGTAAFGDVVHQYPDLQPPRAEFRPADEALAELTLASAEGVPVTYDHPDPLRTPAGLLVSDTTKEHAEGTVLRAWRDGDRFRVRIIAYTPNLQEAIEEGAVELSLGYTLDSELKDGVHQGQPYQAIQRNLKVNHLAVVPANKNARSHRPDGAVARLDTEAKPTPPLAIKASKTLVYPLQAGPKTPMTTRTDAAALSPEALELLKQMPAADQAVLMGLLEAPAAEAVASEEAAEVDDDIAQDQKMIAPLEERIAKLEAMIAKKDEAMKPAKKMAARSDVAPTLDVQAILAQATKSAVEQIEANQKFVQTVRTDGYSANSTTEAGAVMVNVIKDHLPELHDQALGALKEGRFDSISALYKSAERVRRDRAAERQFSSVLSDLPSDPLPTIKDEDLFPA